MVKSKCDKKCKDCGGQLVFYGKDKDGHRKYRCKICNKITSEVQRFTSGRIPNKLLGFLHKLIQNNLYNKSDLSDIFTSASKDASKTKLKNVYFNRMYMKNKNQDSVTINCKNPKLLICQHGDDLILYEIPDIKKNGEGKIIVMDKENFIVKPESNPNYTLFKNR